MRKPDTPDDKIITHEDIFRLPYGEFVRYSASRKSMQAPAQDGVTDGEIVAYVNHGRWIAECPDCAGAQLVSELERRFWCLNCGNAAVNFAWRHVRMPQKRTAIEAELVIRPAAKGDRAITRNWLPGETVKDLQRENVEHGVDSNT
jgi:hypothetical protein